MKNSLVSLSASLVFALLFSNVLPVSAADKVQPVRMGCGAMTFDTVPGWGLGEDGKSVIGPTHGSVVVDKAGNIHVAVGKASFPPDHPPALRNRRVLPAEPCT